MDKAPDFGSGDCRFESCHARPSFTSFRLRGFTQFSSQINLLQCPWPHLEVLLHKYLVTLCCTTWENMLSMIGIILGDIGLHTYLAWRMIHDQEGGSSKARLFHCTSVELTLTITPNVGNLNASFLLVGDCVRAIPLQLRFIFHIFHWDYRCYWKCSREVRATPKIISVKIHVLENKGHGQTQALHTYRINLSPFTKDFRVWGAFIETNLISPGLLWGGSDKDNEYHLIWR